MSWSGSKADFVNQFGSLIKQGATSIGLFPEIALAQAFAEGTDKNSTGTYQFGAAGPMRLGNNVFNIMATPSWKGKTIVWGTNTFRAYDSIADSIADYFNFLQQNSRYKDAGVFTADTAQAQALALQNAGYAGAGNTTYANLLMGVANQAKKLIDAVAEDTDYSDYILGTIVTGGLIIILAREKNKAISGIKEFIPVVELATAAAALYYVTHQASQPPTVTTQKPAATLPPSATSPEPALIKETDPENSINPAF